MQFNNNFAARLRAEVRNPDNSLASPAVSVRSVTDIDFGRFGLFGQVSRNFLNNQLGISAGLRTDMNTFTNTGLNPLQTLSPRVSVSYALNDRWNI